jgi:hypothetical protein
LFGDNWAIPGPKRPGPINASFPSPPGDSQKNHSLRAFWRVLHPAGFLSKLEKGPRHVRSLLRAPHAGFHIETPSRSSSGCAPALVRTHFAAEPLQWCCGRDAGSSNRVRRPYGPTLDGPQISRDDNEVLGPFEGSARSPRSSNSSGARRTGDVAKKGPSQRAQARSFARSELRLVRSKWAIRAGGPGGSFGPSE